MLVKVFSAAVQGINATTVTIEVNLTRGVKFFLVGLPDNAVKESQQRINSALQYNGLRFPSKQIIVNMAPADSIYVLFSETIDQFHRDRAEYSRRHRKMAS